MWFTENAWPPMFIAGIGALACLALWNKDRRGVYFLLALVCLGLIVGFYTLERTIVTPGERLRDDVVLMCDQFRRRDATVLDHISDTAPELKVICKTAMEMVEVRGEIRTTDFQTTFSNNDSRAEVHFRANAEFSVMGWTGHHPLRCILTYQKEGSTFKIVDVARLDPINGKKIEILAPR